MPDPTYTNTEIEADADHDADPDVDTIADALDCPELPDREVIAPRYDCQGKLLPIFRVWMRDGYTLMTHAFTPGEAMSNAIEDARAAIERSGLGRGMSNRERRLMTTVDCWQQVG